MRTITFFSTTCPTCTRAATDPFRTFDAHGNVTAGCVDHFHTGHLVAPSASAAWHACPVAKKLRAADKAGRMGGVTERGAVAA